MSIPQLLELNQTTRHRINELQDQENIQALSQLRVGLKVTFDKREGPMQGAVTKINRKSFTVLAEDGTNQYKVQRELQALSVTRSRPTTSWRANPPGAGWSSE